MEKKVPKFLEKKVQQQPEQSPEPEQLEQQEEQEDSPEETEKTEDSKEPEESEDVKEIEDEETEEELALRTRKEKYYYLHPLNFNHQLLITLTNMVNSLDSINETLKKTNKNTEMLGAVAEEILEKLEK